MGMADAVALLSSESLIQSAILSAASMATILLYSKMCLSQKIRQDDEDGTNAWGFSTWTCREGVAFEHRSKQH